MFNLAVLPLTECKCHVFERIAFVLGKSSFTVTNNGHLPLCTMSTALAKESNDFTYESSMTNQYS